MLVDGICGQVVDIENRINSRFSSVCPLSTTIFKEIIINKKRGKERDKYIIKVFLPNICGHCGQLKKEEFNERNLDQSFRRGGAE